MTSTKLTRREQRLSNYIFKLIKQYVNLDKTCGSSNEKDDTALHQLAFHEFISKKVIEWLENNDSDLSD